jgi:hypothetical protein
MESGEAFDDPSEDLLFELLGDIERGDEQFLIVTRLTDPSNETYAQTVRNDDGSWLVERRDGSRERHFAATLPDLGDVHRVMTAWAFELEGWEALAVWQPIVV